MFLILQKPQVFDASSKIYQAVKSAKELSQLKEIKN